MTNYTKLILLALFAFVSCTDNESMLENQCLVNAEPQENDNIIRNCNSFIVKCENVQYLGTSELSTASKERFSDYCNAVDQRIHFENNTGELTTALITEKSYLKSFDLFSVASNSTTNCEHTCLDGERATIRLKSNQFSISIALERGLITLNSFVLAPHDRVITNFTVHTNPSLGSLIEVPIEDENYNPIELRNGSSESYLLVGGKFHSTIELHGKTYTNVYNNRARNTLNEIVYFSIDEGLVAVQDSFGVLWTRME